MLPTSPAGHCGSPRNPGSTGIGGRPSRAIASRAHQRAVVNSCRRLSTDLRMIDSSSGKRVASGRSVNVSTATVPAGRIASIMACSPPDREWWSGPPIAAWRSSVALPFPRR
jgi:hypothetical protein